MDCDVKEDCTTCILFPCQYFEKTKINGEEIYFAMVSVPYKGCGQWILKRDGPFKYCEQESFYGIYYKDIPVSEWPLIVQDKKQAAIAVCWLNWLWERKETQPQMNCSARDSAFCKTRCDENSTVDTICFLCADCALEQDCDAKKASPCGYWVGKRCEDCADTFCKPGKSGLTSCKEFTADEG